MTDKLKAAAEVALEALYNFADDESVDGWKAIDAIGIVRKALAESCEIEAAVLAEREACARLCDRLYRQETAHAQSYGGGYWFVSAKDCAKKIRARGE